MAVAKNGVHRRCSYRTSMSSNDNGSSSSAEHSKSTSSVAVSYTSPFADLEDNPSADQNQPISMMADDIDIEFDEDEHGGDGLFAWLKEFNLMSKEPFPPGYLFQTITFFKTNVIAIAPECHKTLSNTKKLKVLVKETMMQFVYQHRLEQNKNTKYYYELMSDLLAVYCDLEIVASAWEVKISPRRISTRIVSTISITLDCSPQYTLDTILKMKFLDARYINILDLVIPKIMQLCQPPPNSSIIYNAIDGAAYVRYLLVYRIWRELHSDPTMRQNIVESAIMTLTDDTPIDIPLIVLERGILPPDVQGEKPTTRHYMCQPYDIHKAYTDFIDIYKTLDFEEDPPPMSFVPTGISVPIGIGVPTVVVPTNSVPTISVSATREPTVCKTTISVSANGVPSICENGLSIPTTSLNSSSESTEHSPELEKSTVTSEQSELCFVNNALSKPSKTAEAQSSVVKIPLEKLHLNPNKSHIASVKSKSKKLSDIVLIDITDDEVTKIVKRKKRNKLGWLEYVNRHFHAKLVSLKIEELSFEDAPSPLDITEDKRLNEIEFEKLLSSYNLDVSALSNGCSVIRETGRPAAVVTPKTDIEPKVQEEYEDSSMYDEELSLKSSEASSEVTSNYYEGIDGLTLLASVSAQQQVSTKKPELKVKPYTTLQQPESIIEDTMDKVALQVEVCSSEPVIKQDFYSYILEEQTNSEANDNANVILNGETVMLLQKSPNSNLYIINKAAVDNCKLNYNSDDEMMGLELSEDIKPALKMEPVIEYPTHIPHCVHQLSVDCACVSCAYCRTYFISAPSQPPPPVTTNSTKDKTYSRLKEVDRKLPLKKRLMAQRMMDFNQTKNHIPPFEIGAVVEVTSADKSNSREEIVPNVFPPTPPLEFSADVKMTTVEKHRGRDTKKDKSINQNIPNCFSRKPGPKKKRLASTESEVEKRVLAPPAKKARRSSRRGSAAVSYVDYEHEADFNPSGKRKKKRTTR